MTTPKPASRPQAAVAATTTVPAPRARRKRLSPVNGIARQFGDPSGPIGHLVTGLLARGNADSTAGWSTNSARGAAPATRSSNSATVPASHSRNCWRLSGRPVSASTVARRAEERAAPQRTGHAGGRLTLVTGDIEEAVGYVPADLVVACHVLYFWARPGERTAAHTRDPGAPRPRRPRLPAPPAHAADLPAHLPPGGVHPLRLRRPSRRRRGAGRFHPPRDPHLRRP